MDTLKEKIIVILSQSASPLKAKAIAKLLNEPSTTKINSTLYSYRNVFIINDKYEWTYVPNIKTPPTSPPVDSCTKTNEQRACLNCGKIFLYNKYKSNKKFCDIKCRLSFNSPKSKPIIRENRQCLYCKKVFVWNSSNPNKKYCSTDCLKNATFEKTHNDIFSEIRHCDICGKEFEWNSSKPTKKYCSAECRKVATKMYSKKRSKNDNQDALEELRAVIFLKVSEIIGKMNQSEGHTFSGKYIDYWEIGDISTKTREKVLERDGYECQICKRKDSLHLHHLIKRINGGDHSAENLITLCASCHRHIETEDIQHATSKCLKNAKKYFGLSEEKSVMDLEDLKLELNNLFDKIKKSEVGKDTEIMVQLDEALDILYDNT